MAFVPGYLLSLNHNRLEHYLPMPHPLFLKPHYINLLVHYHSETAGEQLKAPGALQVILLS